MKKLLLILPFLFVLLMQTSTVPASAHSYGWYRRHEARAMMGYGGYGYNRGFNPGYGYGNPGCGYTPGLLGGVHRLFTGYYR